MSTYKHSFNYKITRIASVVPGEYVELHRNLHNLSCRAFFKAPEVMNDSWLELDILLNKHLAECEEPFAQTVKLIYEQKLPADDDTYWTKNEERLTYKKAFHAKIQEILALLKEENLYKGLYSELCDLLDETTQTPPEEIHKEEERLNEIITKYTPIFGIVECPVAVQIHIIMQKEYMDDASWQKSDGKLCCVA